MQRRRVHRAAPAVQRMATSPGASVHSVTSVGGHGGGSAGSGGTRPRPSPARPPPPTAAPPLDEDDDEPAALAAAAARAAARLSQVVSKHTFVAAVKRKPIPANAAELIVRIRDSDSDNIAVELGPPPPELAGVITEAEFVNDINEGVIGAVRAQLGPLSRRLFWGRVLASLAILVGIGLIIGSVVRARDAYLAAQEAWLQAVNSAGRVLAEPDPSDYGPVSNQPALFFCGLLGILGGFATLCALGWIGGTCGRGTAVRLLRTQVSRQLNRPMGRFKQRGIAFGVHVEDVIHLNYEPDLRTLICDPEEYVYVAIRIMAPFPLRQPMTPATHGCVPDPDNPALSSGLVLSECGPLVVPDDCVPRPGDPSCSFVLVSGIDYCSPVNGSPAAPVRMLPTELELIAAEEAAAAARIPTLGGGGSSAIAVAPGLSSIASPGPADPGIAMVQLPRVAGSSSSSSSAAAGAAEQGPNSSAANEDDVSIAVSPMALAVGRRRVPVNAAGSAAGAAGGSSSSAGGGSFAVAPRKPPGISSDGSSSGRSTAVATRNALPAGLSRVYRDADADADADGDDYGDGAGDEGLYAPDVESGAVAAAAHFASASPLDGPRSGAGAMPEFDSTAAAAAAEDGRNRRSSQQGRTKRRSRTGTEIAAIAASSRRRASGPAAAAAFGGEAGAGGGAAAEPTPAVAASFFVASDAASGDGAGTARRRGVSSSPAAPPALARLPTPVAPPPAPPGIRIASNPSATVAIAAAAAAAQAAASAAVSAVSQRNLLQSPSSSAAPISASGALSGGGAAVGAGSFAPSSSGVASSGSGSSGTIRTVTARSIAARVMPRASRFRSTRHAQGQCCSWEGAVDFVVVFVGSFRHHRPPVYNFPPRGHPCG